MEKKVVFALITLVLLLFPVQAYGAQDESRPIAVQGALDVEVKYFLEQMQDYRTETFGSYTFYTGKIGSIPVVVSRTDVGMVNAAASTMLLIEKYNPKAIINQGTAGGHDPDLHRYDIVIGQYAVNYGKFNTKHRDQGTGMAPDTWTVAPTTIRENGGIKSYPRFESDPALFNVAMDLAKEYKRGKAVSGVIGSADEWNRELDRIEWLHENVGTSSEDMETASAAQVAKSFNVPFLGIRILSNSEWHEGESFDPNAAIYCAEFVTEVIKAIDRKVEFPVQPAVYVNQEKLMDKYAEKKNGTLMVPLRSVMERLGADVKWDGEKYRVIVHYMGKDVVIAPGERSVSLGQAVYPLTEAPVLVDGTVWTGLQLLETAFQLKTDVLASSVYIDR